MKQFWHKQFDLGTNMKCLLTLIIISALQLPITLAAGDLVSFEEAKELSSVKGKPLLLEFFRED